MSAITILYSATWSNFYVAPLDVATTWQDGQFDVTAAEQIAAEGTVATISITNHTLITALFL